MNAVRSDNAAKLNGLITVFDFAVGLKVIQ
jgi:hypothetical protein